MRNIVAKLAVSLLIGGLVLVASTPASAWEVGLDFITSGGWFIIQNPYYPVLPLAVPGGRANFGWHGGVKNGAYWGNGNYIDHALGAHVHNTLVRDYICVSGPCPATSHQPQGTREICGNATVNGSGTWYYRVRLNDSGEPGAGNAGGNDKFGIIVFNQNYDEMYLAEGIPINGGNVQLHRQNPSNTAPSPSGFCDFLMSHTTFDFTFN
ncbi:MAG: hypothetical protein E6K11_07495 [Methanobacteriota archaeon]|nr:MAG: hypothetical protein E6K11_07495 [Euryarchaeota archaeon]